MADQLDNYRLLGRSGLRVSPLCLGTMTFGVPQGWGSSDAEAEQMFRRYVELGGNFLDTANFYGAMGGSERVVGKLVANQRHRFVIATKYTMTMDAADVNASGNHRKNMQRAVEDSLERMKTDYIDLLYLHMWDQTTPVEEVLRSFDDLVRSGKVVYVGISDTPAWQVSRMQAIAELRGWSPLVALQIPYSLIERTVERELMPMARELGLGVLPWSPLGGGVLSGKYSTQDLDKSNLKGGIADSRKNINVMTGRLTERSLNVARETKAIAEEMGRTSAQVALAWTLLNPVVTSTILGVRTPTQLADNLGALEVTFTPEQIARLQAASCIEPVFPYDMMDGPARGTMLGNFKVQSRG